ncbi:MAG: DUF4240 domain-containing protein [Saprospiraceae bacterium]|nr:DUF4240 domain-containing protein [Saprospiraceae bacterium]
MISLSVKLEDELSAQIRARAEASGMGEEALVVKALQDFLYSEDQPKASAAQQFFPQQDVKVEWRAQAHSPADDLFSDSDFWGVIELIDWSKKTSEEKLLPAVQYLAEKPVSNIYLFADKLSEKLYPLDTKQHASAYAAHEPEQFVSADDFLYARCAVVAEGREYYEQVLNNPSQMPSDIVFEPLLSLADDAFELKTGAEFKYIPAYNYETHSNKAGWQ